MLWIDHFEGLLKILTTGRYERELFRAKEIFFRKLGRSHEERNNFYEAISQSFLEWYVFDYVCEDSKKTPAITFFARDAGTSAQRDFVKSALFHHWSFFKVLDIKDDQPVLEDLLIGCRRRYRADKNESPIYLWKPKVGQIVQARLFEREDQSNFATHVWVHPDSEYEGLEKLFAKLKLQWGLHRELLKDFLEGLLRSLEIGDQLRVVGGQNWIYQELIKTYAKKK